MAFQVSCPSCDSQMKLPDRLYEQRVRGRLATIRCTRCKAELQVDGRKTPEGNKPPSVRPAALERAEARTAEPARTETAKPAETRADGPVETPEPAPAAARAPVPAPSAAQPALVRIVASSFPPRAL